MVPLGEAAYQRLRADIVSCRLAPGQRLTGRGLAARMGLGVAPVRDALTRLDQEGLVRTVPRKGYQVKPLTLKVVNDLFSFWLLAGPETVRLGVAGATAQELGQARAGFAELARLVREGGPAREVALAGNEVSRRTFAILAAATHNDYFLSTFQRVAAELSRVWILVIGSELLQQGGMSADADEWDRVFTHRDGLAAAELTRRYIVEARHRVIRTLASWPSVAATEVKPLPGP